MCQVPEKITPITTLFNFHKEASSTTLPRMARYRPPPPTTTTIAHEIGSPNTNPRYFQITLPIKRPCLNPLREIHRYIQGIAVGSEHPSGTTERVTHLEPINRKYSKDHREVTYTIEVHYAVYDIQ